MRARTPFAALLLTLVPALASAQDDLPRAKRERAALEDAIRQKKLEAARREAQEDDEDDQDDQDRDLIRRKKLEAAEREALREERGEEDEDEGDAIRRKKLAAAEDDCEACDDADDEGDGDVVRRKKLEAPAGAEEEREQVRRKKLWRADRGDREERLRALKLGVEEACRQIEAEARARIEAVRAKARAEAQRMASEDDRGDWKEQARGDDEADLRARLERLEAAVQKLAELVERLAARER